MANRSRVLSCAATALAASTGACALSPAPPAPPPATTGQVLAQSACPHRIDRSEAWVNLMPGPRRGPRDIHVQLMLADPKDTALLLKAPATRPGELTLEIRTAPTSPIPGQLAYREPASDPWPARIVILCRGGEIHAIDRIEPVY
jgi:hypothetical protein